jgi:hypothetical protein
MSQSAPSYAHALPSTAAQCETALSGPGKALSSDLRAEFETSLDADLSNVRVHTTDATAAATARANARAFAFGNDIGFAAGAFQPDTPRGRALIGHELVHVVQSRRGGSGARARAEAEADALAARVAEGSPVQVQRSAPEGPAFALDDYFFSSPNIQAMTLSQVEDDIAEITEYLDRQFETNEETIRLQQALEALRARRAELLRGTTQQPPARRQRRSGRRRRQPTEDTPLPADAPRVLRERTSRPLTDPDEIRAETDRIVAWLNRSDLSREDRAILQDELRALAPQSEEARRIDAARRHSARIRRAFQSRSASGDQTATLRHQLGIVESIYTDPAEPQVRFIVHEGERIRISVEHANELRQRSTQALRNAIRNARDQAASAMRRYRFQQRLNEDQPIVSTIAGWLGGVDDPWTAVIRAKTRADAGVRNATIHLDENRLVRAVGPIVQAAEAAARLKRAVDAWRDGLISGAGLAVGVLTFVRDASAAIATAIAAVVAAPVVAGYAAGLGLGATGTAVATTAGTGLVVGTGSGVAGGGAEYAGQRIAGASHSEASSAAGTEFTRRFAEGAAAGVGGGVTRVAGQALRVGGTVGNQVVRRGAAEAVGNFAGTTTGGVLQGRDLDVAAGQGLRTAGLSVVGNTVGSLGRSAAAREALEFGTNAVTSTADTLAQGGDLRDAALNLTVMTASQGALSRSPGRQSEIAGYERQATRTGQRHRSRAQSTIGAVGLGIQTALPPSGFGGSAPLDLSTTPIVQRSQTGATPEFTAQTAPAQPTSTQAPASRAQRPTTPTSETQSAPQQTRQQSVDPSLELETRPWQQRRTSEVQDPSLRTQRDAGDVDRPLELDTRPVQERGVSEARDPSLRDLGESTGTPLRLDRRSTIPSARPRRETDHSRDTGITSGSERRTGTHLNEYNPAEIGQTRLRFQRDGRGRTQVVHFRLTAEAVASTQSTTRSFTWDPSTQGPQAVTSDYTGTGFDRGHLAPREAASLNESFVAPEFRQSHAELQAQTERAMDHMTNVVPMAREFNQRGAWRQAERQANQWATRFGEISVEIRPHYGDNPQHLPSGVEVPAGFIRIERRPNGRILRRRYYPNE